MEVLIQRKQMDPECEHTDGVMSVDGKHYCATLEDKDRGLTQDMPLDDIKRIKVYGKTAIPKGHYELDVVYWSKHKINVPTIKNVPGYTSILIHNGATVADTLGCPLVGDFVRSGRITAGKKYMVELTNRITAEKKQGRKSYITIE